MMSMGEPERLVSCESLVASFEGENKKQADKVCKGKTYQLGVTSYEKKLKGIVDLGIQYLKTTLATSN